MQTVHQIDIAVQPVRRRRSLAALASLTSAACLATVLPFAVGIARPAAPDRPRAPRGGIEVAGRFYRGGSFLPASSPAPVAESVASYRDDDDDSEGPAWTWPAWTDADTWELGPDVEPEDTRDHAVAFAPSRYEELYRLGYELGLERENARISAIAAYNAANSDDLADLAAFHGGYLAGKAEWDARLEEMCGDAAYAEFSAGITERDIYQPGATS